MSNKVIYECQALTGTNKVGLLKPDANGYYELVLGAYDFHNEAGAFYPLEPLKKLMENSSPLMRRIRDGYVKSECGHPRMTPGMSDRDFLMRVCDIQETNVCAHIKSIELDDERVMHNGQKVAAIIGMVKPSGPKGDALEKSLSNPDENVAFSVRSLTNDYWTPAGKLIKEVDEIITWDLVNQPGINVANKYRSPALESHGFDLKTVRDAAQKMQGVGFGMESANQILNNILRERAVMPIRRHDDRIGRKPLSSRWT